MKKVFIISLSVFALGFMSCKKCQTCTTKVTQEVFGYQQQVSANSDEYCGKEYDNAPEETSFTQDVGGATQTVTIECTDN